jgi:hypothetical protein
MGVSLQEGSMRMGVMLVCVASGWCVLGSACLQVEAHVGVRVHCIYVCLQ